MNSLSYYIFITIFFILNLFSLDNFHEWGDDFGLYLHQSKSINEGKLDELNIANTDMMEHGKTGPFLYPLGYPLLISPIMFFSSKFIYIKFLNSLILSLVIIISNKIACFFLDQRSSRILATLFGTSSFIFFSTSFILSDLFSLFLVLYTLLLYINIKTRKKNTNSNLLIYIILILCCLITRNSNMFFMFGLIIYDIIEYTLRRKKIPGLKYGSTLYLTFSTIILYLFLVKWFPLLNRGQNEFAHLIDNSRNLHSFIQTIKSNVIYYLELISLDLMNWRLVLCLIATSILYVTNKSIITIRAKNDIKITQFNTFNHGKYFLLIVLFFSTISIFLIWPYKQGVRFILFNMFIIFLFMSIIIVRISSKLFHSISLAYFFVFSASPIIGVVFLGKNIYTVNNSIPADLPGSSSFNTMMGYISESTPDSSIIISMKPRAVHYFADRKGYVPSNENMKFGNYLLIRNKEDSIELRYLFDQCDTLIYKSGTLELFKIAK